MPRRPPKPADSKSSGKLRIGDHWNAISIIALSQSNPLKAVAEFVENSIDAQARHITITRGKRGGDQYLRIVDDGEGVPRDGEGFPNFRYVATHICDSIKRRLSAADANKVQGEFGIGLLSFWTVGERLTMLSAAANGKTYQMRMVRGKPDYTVEPRRVLFAEGGTSLTVQPLLSGIRQFSGEKLQWYLASELRDRIRKSGVKIDIIDRQARAQYRVQPRKFHGRLLPRLPEPSTTLGAVYVELYLADPKAENQVALYRSGTRVLPSITELDELQGAPWTSGYLLGIIDAPFLNLTPRSRLGIIQDEAFGMFRLCFYGDDEQCRQDKVRMDELSPRNEHLHNLRRMQWHALRRFQPLPGTTPGYSAEDVIQGSEAVIEKMEKLWPRLTTEASATDRVAFAEIGNPFYYMSGTVQSPSVIENLAITHEGLGRDAEGRVALSNDQELKVVYYNFDPVPLRIGAALWRWTAGGTYQDITGVDSYGDDMPDSELSRARTVLENRGETVLLTLAPRMSTVLDLTQLEAGDGVGLKPDLAVVAEEMVYNTRWREVEVTLHNIGAVEAEDFEVVFSTVDDGGRSEEIERVHVSFLNWPLDFDPKTMRVGVPYVQRAEKVRYHVDVDLQDRLDEITERSNRTECLIELDPRKLLGRIVPDNYWARR